MTSRFVRESLTAGYYGNHLNLNWNYDKRNNPFPSNDPSNTPPLQAARAENAKIRDAKKREEKQKEMKEMEKMKREKEKETYVHNQIVQLSFTHRLPLQTKTLCDLSLLCPPPLEQRRICRKIAIYNFFCSS